MTPGLAHQRVLVTRASGQAETLSELLRDAGAATIEIPAIRIEPVANTTMLDAALDRHADYDWIIITSANGATITCDRLAALGIPLDALRARVLAVGPTTAHTLTQRGLRVDIVPEPFLGAAIPDYVGDVADHRILWPRGAAAPPTLATTLRAMGATVDDVVAYHTHQIMDRQALRSALQSGIDIITLTSGSAAESLACALGKGAELPRNIVVACIGPTTAKKAQQFSLPVHVVSSEHTVAGLVHALIEYCATTSAPAVPSTLLQTPL